MTVIVIPEEFPNYTCNVVGSEPASWQTVSIQDAFPGLREQSGLQDHGQCGQRDGNMPSKPCPDRGD